MRAAFFTVQLVACEAITTSCEKCTMSLVVKNAANVSDCSLGEQATTVQSLSSIFLFLIWDVSTCWCHACQLMGHDPWQSANKVHRWICRLETTNVAAS